MRKPKATAGYHSGLHLSGFRSDFPTAAARSGYRDLLCRRAGSGVLHMSKQQFVVGVQPVTVGPWVQGASLMVAPDAMPAANSSADRKGKKSYVIGAVDPIDDPIEPWRRLQERLEPLLSAPDQQGDFPALMEALALDILQMVEIDPDLAILAIVRLDPFDYAVAHALQAAVACDVYGHAQGTPPEQRIVLIQAALTMNIAMLDLQRELEWQSTPPTLEQRRLIYQHPQRGREILEALGVRDENWLRAVAAHHEAPDGSGYPTGCQSACREADVLAIADRYCALLSRRGARDSMAGNAAQSLYSAAHGKRLSLVARVIDVFGQHPPGSLVRLVNGEIAIVIRRSNAFRDEQVCALGAADGEPLAEPLLRDVSEPPHVIVGSVGDRELKGTIDYAALRRLMN